jgi:hypothetical protein
MPLVAVTSFLAGTLAPGVSSDTKSPKYFEVDYMKVNPGKEADYLKVEREDWKPPIRSASRRAKSGHGRCMHCSFPQEPLRNMTTLLSTPSTSSASLKTLTRMLKKCLQKSTLE